MQKLERRHFLLSVLAIFGLSSGIARTAGVFLAKSGEYHKNEKLEFVIVDGWILEIDDIGNST